MPGSRRRRSFPAGRRQLASSPRAHLPERDSTAESHHRQPSNESNSARAAKAASSQQRGNIPKSDDIPDKARPDGADPGSKTNRSSWGKGLGSAGAATTAAATSNPSDESADQDQESNRPAKGSRHLSAASRLGRLRVAAGLSQTEAAQALGMGNQGLISQLERGVRILTPELAERLAAVYGTTAEELLAAAPTPAADVREAALSSAPTKSLQTDEPSSLRSPPTELPDSTDAVEVWFAGHDQFSSRRRKIRRACLQHDLEARTAQLISVALVPWLAKSPATYEFFEELRALREELPPSGPEWARTTGPSPNPSEILARYQELSASHGEPTYAEAFNVAYHIGLLTVEAFESPRGQHNLDDAARPESHVAAPVPSAPDGPAVPNHEGGTHSLPAKLHADVETLDRAISDRRPVRITLRQGNPRTLEPYVRGLIGKSAQVAGYDRGRGTVRRFDLDEVLTIELIDRETPFDRPGPERLERAMNQFAGAREALWLSPTDREDDSPSPTRSPNRDTEQRPQVPNKSDEPKLARQKGPTVRDPSDLSLGEHKNSERVPDPETIFKRLEQDVPEQATATSSTGPPERISGALPHTLPLRVGQHDLLLGRESHSRSEIVYLLMDPSTGHPARAGIRIDDEKELPAFVELNGQQLRLGPSHLWNPTLKAYEEEPQPFECLRSVVTKLVIYGHQFDATVRLSRRSDVQWFVMARLFPSSTTSQVASTHDLYRASRPESGTAASQSPTPEEDTDEGTVNLESIGGAPAIATPLFKLEGLWHCRWAVDRNGSGNMIPRELFELNGVGLTPMPKLETADGVEVHLEAGKFGSYHVLPQDALLDASGARTGDYLFIGIDARGKVELRRVTSQRLGRAASHLKVAALLCGLRDERPALASVVWALGAEGSDLETAVAIAEQRADGQLVRELRAHAREAAPPPDLTTTFSQL